MKQRRFLILLLFLLMVLIAIGCAKKEVGEKRTKFSEVNGYYGGVDDLGRQLAITTDKNIPSYREGKYVGIFYFLWLGEQNTTPLYDVSKIMASDPDAGQKPSLWGGNGIYHFWGEPLFGYYYSTDEWVMRKHVQMLTDADIDFLVFDTTNAASYATNALKLMAILQEYKDEGWDVPGVVFYTNTRTGETMNQIYRVVYEKHPEYEDIWFKVNDKPLIIGRPEDSVTLEEVKEFFTIKHSQWPNERQGGTEGIHYFEDGFPWMAFERPQHHYGKSLDLSIMSVSIAQHQSTVRFSDTALYGDDTNWTRSYHNGKNDKAENAYMHGYNFQEQWDYALSQDPDIVFVTGWNEWIAGNWASSNTTPLVFVDCCDINTSRDSEPMRGGYGDNYYMQLVNNIRRFKGVKDPVNAHEKITIDVSGSFSQWDLVKALYKDYENDTPNRKGRGYGGQVYEDTSGRNDIVTMKVTHDDKNIYFYVETKAILSHHEDDAWMTLFIKTGKKDNWYGYDFVVNRVSPGFKAVLEKSKGGFNWEKVDDCSYRFKDNKMQIAIPREKLGLTGKIDIEFKWADNYEPGDIWSFYTNGDAAPYGRMNYVYSETA